MVVKCTYRGSRGQEPPQGCVVRDDRDCVSLSHSSRGRVLPSGVAGTAGDGLGLALGAILSGDGSLQVPARGRAGLPPPQK